MVGQPKHLRLNVILQQEDGVWVARCPELDTLAADADPETAWEDIIRVCRATLAYGFAKGQTLAQLMKPPPANLLEIIAQAEVDGMLKIDFKCVAEFTVLRMKAA